MTRTVTVFRVLPRATNEAPILPCPRPPPIYIIIFPSSSCSLLSSLLSRIVSVFPQFAVSTLRDLLSSLLLTLLQRPISVTSVLLDGLKILLTYASGLPSSSSLTLIFSSDSYLYPSVQLALSLSLLPLSLFRHSLLRIFVRNSNPQKRKKYL